MKYTFRSEMLEDLTPTSPRILQHTYLCLAWPWVSWVLLPLAYAGALIAPAFVLSLPLQLLRKHHFSTYAVWITVALIALFAGWWLYKGLACSARAFRQHVIYLEAMVFSAGLVLALVLIIWLFPRL